MSRPPNWNDDIVMKSVNAFFTPATKKVKYYCEGETNQTTGREQVGELNLKRNNTREGQSEQAMQGLWSVLKICDVGFVLCSFTTSHYIASKLFRYDSSFDFSYTTLRYTKSFS